MQTDPHQLLDAYGDFPRLFVTHVGSKVRIEWVLAGVHYTNDREDR